MKPHSTMSTWKSHILARLNKRSFTTSNKAKMHRLIPPETGWIGGDARTVNALGRKAPL